MNLRAPPTRGRHALVCAAVVAGFCGAAPGQSAGPPVVSGAGGPLLPLLSPCDIPFGGADCLPLNNLQVAGATLAERFVGQNVGGSAPQNETLGGAPNNPLTLAGVTLSDGLTEYLGTVSGLGGGGCVAESLGEGVVAVLFAQPQRRVIVTPQFLDGGTGSARAFAVNGQQLTSKTGSGALELLAGATPIRGVSLISTDPGGLGWTLYAEPWNLLTGTDPLAAANAASHHTQGFPSGLQVRRGEAAGVQVRVTLAAPFDADVNELRFRVEHDFDGATSVIPVDPHGSDPAQWTSELVQIAPGGLSVDALLNVPVTAATGSYQLVAELWLVNCAGPQLVDELGFTAPMTVLFNPWATADGVYMPAVLLDEYLLSDHTLLWRGNWNSPQPWTWRYGSFGADALAAALAALQGQPSIVRRDPVLVARRLAAYTDAVNGGLLSIQLVGPWLGGTSPAAWTGSDQIFAAWVAAGGLPVKFGSDGVAAGVLASLCRTLGIASRPVSAYFAARDTDTIAGGLDLAFTATGHLDTAASIDRLWDQHAWTEAYMRRPDLPGANGWQALDGTSMLPGGDGHAGPAAVVKIQMGAVGLPYDTGFFRTLVDSDVRVWRPDGLGQPTLLSSDQGLVGKSLLTKAAGVDSAESLTFAYKLAPLPAGPDGPLPGSGISVSFHPPLSVPAGEPLEWRVTLLNTTSVAQTVHVALDGHVLGADGEPAGLLGTLDSNTPVPKFGQADVTLSVGAAEYAPWLSVGQQFQVSLGVDVVAVGDYDADFGRTRLQLPDVELDVTPAHSTTLGGSLTVQAGVINPLPVPLTNVSATFAAAPGLSFGGLAQVTVPVGTVGAGAAVVVSRLVQGTAVGAHSVSVSLLSDQLAGAAASTTISVGGPWTDLGQGLAGVDGVPLLFGDGPLLPGSAGAITLEGAAPLAPCTLLVGFVPGSVPFKGGVLVPFPIALNVPLGLDPYGNSLLPWTSWPAGLPSGAGFLLQAWLADAAGPQGFAASNALRGVTP
jgi:Transglutaminase-like superfamily/Transglutaminase family